jgi:ribonuclease HI
MGQVDDPDSILTNNAMVYHAVLNLFGALPSGSSVTIRSDARIVVAQLMHRFRVRTERLRPLADEVFALQKSKKLIISVIPVKLDDNPAATHLATQYKTEFRRALRYEPVEI